MIIAKVYLSKFRNFSEKLLEFGTVNVIVGDNGTGKTNIIEAIRLLSTGKSFKASKNEEMLAYDEDLARVKGLLKDDEEEVKPEVVITKGEIAAGNTVKKVPRKRLLVNGVGKRLIDFSGILRTVIFTPEDMELVTATPTVRRRFLDAVLTQVNREYYRSLLSYEKGLRQRNKLLFAIREMGADRSQLTFWDRLLIKNGEYIAEARGGLVDFINDTDSLNHLDFEIEYDRSVISEGRLAQYKREEVAAVSTLVGPHRDDLIFKVGKDGEKKRELGKYGSRGEQRMGVLWVKLAEMAYVEEKSEGKPILLLDDIFSELDHDHRDVVMEATEGHQVIITTADPHFVEQYEIGNLINLK